MEVKGTITLTVEELRVLIRTTVDETLERLGIEVDEPQEMQQDFVHLRSMRVTMAQVQRRGVLTMIGLTVAALITLLILGVKAWLRGGSSGGSP
jgi:hypothetical protein